MSDKSSTTQFHVTKEKVKVWEQDSVHVIKGLQDPRREVYEFDGWVCDLDMMDTPSKLSVIRKTTTLGRVVEDSTDWLHWHNSWNCKKTVSFPMIL